MDKVEHKITLEERLRARKVKSKGWNPFKGNRKQKKSDMYEHKSNTALFQDLEEAAIEWVKSKKVPTSWHDLLTSTKLTQKLTVGKL